MKQPPPGLGGKTQPDVQTIRVALLGLLPRGYHTDP